MTPLEAPENSSEHSILESKATKLLYKYKPKEYKIPSTLFVELIEETLDTMYSFELVNIFIQRKSPEDQKELAEKALSQAKKLKVSANMINEEPMLNQSLLIRTKEDAFDDNYFFEPDFLEALAIKIAAIEHFLKHNTLKPKNKLSTNRAVINNLQTIYSKLCNTNEWPMSEKSSFVMFITDFYEAINKHPPSFDTIRDAVRRK